MLETHNQIQNAEKNVNKLRESLLRNKNRFELKKNSKKNMRVLIFHRYILILLVRCAIASPRNMLPNLFAQLKNT